MPLTMPSQNMYHECETILYLLVLLVSIAGKWHVLVKEKEVRVGGYAWEGVHVWEGMYMWEGMYVHGEGVQVWEGVHGRVCRCGRVCVFDGCLCFHQDTTVLSCTRLRSPSTVMPVTNSCMAVTSRDTSVQVLTWCAFCCRFTLHPLLPLPPNMHAHTHTWYSMQENCP